MKHYSLIFEQEHFMVIVKAPGCIVYGDKSQTTLVTQLHQHFNSRSLYPCHRLDQDTSGLMLIAKSRQSNTVISRAFEQRAICKHYVALSDKRPNKKQGDIRGDMVKSRGGSWKLTREQVRPAITHFKSQYIPDIAKRFFWLKPQTGKTHQLRVALKSLGSPIIGDRRYKGTVCDRLYLHACGLRFELFGRCFEFYSLPKVGHYFVQKSFEDVFAESVPSDFNADIFQVSL